MKLLSRNPDKPKKQLETTIGKIIYGFLLFMPLLAVIVACGYVIINKNAYQSYSDYTQINYINANGTQIQEGQEYQIRYNPNGSDTSYYYNNILDGKTNINDLFLKNTQYYNKIVDRWTIEQSNTLYLFFTDNTYTGIINWFNTSYNFNFIAKSIGASNIVTTNKYYSQYSVNYVTGTLDNVFYHELEHLEESTLFNWTKTTGTYDVVHNTTQLLGITNTYIPMLLTYWLMISVMYFVYDIALMLIMVVHRKIHELQESI